MKYLWKIGGEAGFGIMTTGLLFSTISSRSGYHVYDYTEYPSLIRGGHNTTDVLVSDGPATAIKQEIDMLVCLNKETYELHKDRLHKNSLVIYDSEQYDVETECIRIGIPFRRMKHELKARQIMINTIAMGATLALLEGDMELYYQMIRDEFSRKGDAIVDFNIKLAAMGADHVKKQYSEYIRPILTRRENEPQLVMTGNDAFSLACVMADCRMYVAYPMTPASTVLSSLAGWEKQTGMIVRHAEDEISVVNTALGSSMMGVRAAVGTSGGGFALMVESISFAGVAEIPLVMFLSQRPGPATGMPTWTEQGDLLFAVHAGHGEFPKIVLTPGDIHEMIDLTLRAFDYADIYQTPVIVISDKMLSESHQSWSKKEIMDLPVKHPEDRGKTVTETKQQPYLRYRLTEDGISERLLPGAAGHFYQNNSYEHSEDSHTSEQAEDRLKQVHKRHQKTVQYLANHFEAPRVFGSIEEAELVFVSWGGNKNVILASQALLAEQGIMTAYIHFTYIYPMHVDKVMAVLPQDKRMVLVENNSTGQFGKLLRAETGIHLDEKLLKYDGRPFMPEEIVDYVISNR